MVDLFGNMASRKKEEKKPFLMEKPDLHDFFNIMMDFQDANEDYVRLYQNYVDTEVYKEIVNFLDIAQPDWRKKKGLGQ